MHPIIDEICRAKDGNIRHEVLRRWQLVLRMDVQPLLDELERLKAEKKDPEAVES